MKYRKKPLVIDAKQWFRHGDHPAVLPYGQSIIDHFPGYEKCGVIKTLEDRVDTLHHVVPGDWIITGIQGEFYPIKDDIFKQTYETVDAGRGGPTKAL